MSRTPREHSSSTSADATGREEVCAALEIPLEWLPPVYESTEIAGAGDQAAAALGVGIARPGPVSVVLGTSGVVFSALPAYEHDREGRLHAFCHAVPDTWHAMGVMLSAAGSAAWLRGVLAAGLADLDAGGCAVAGRQRGSALRAVPRRRANAPSRSGRARRVRRSLRPPRPRRALAGDAGRRRLRAARLARAAPRARRPARRAAASRAAAHAASSGSGSSPRCSVSRSRRPSRRRDLRSAPRSSPACERASSRTPTTRSLAASGPPSNRAGVGLRRCLPSLPPALPDPQTPRGAVRTRASAAASRRTSSRPRASRAHARPTAPGRARPSRASPQAG